MRLTLGTARQGKARIRVMISAAYAYARDDLDNGLEAFKTVGKKLGVV